MTHAARGCRRTGARRPSRCRGGARPRSSRQPPTMSTASTASRCRPLYARRASRPRVWRRTAHRTRRLRYGGLCAQLRLCRARRAVQEGEVEARVRGKPGIGRIQPSTRTSSRSGRSSVRTCGRSRRAPRRVTRFGSLTPTLRARGSRRCQRFRRRRRSRSMAAADRASLIVDGKQLLATLGKLAKPIRANVHAGKHMSAEYVKPPIVRPTVTTNSPELREILLAVIAAGATQSPMLVATGTEAIAHPPRLPQTRRRRPRRRL